MIPKSKQTKDGKILIAGNKSEFLVAATKAELERRKYSVETCDPTVNAINEACEDVKVCLLFIDAVIGLNNLYIFLKDNIFDRRIGLILVGERLGLREACSEIGEDNIDALFERPVDAKEVSDGVERSYDRVIRSGGKKSVLIIDDEPEFLRRTQSLLKDRYKTYIANSGASAMMLLAKHRVDLILLDYMMPIVDGAKVLEMLKSEPDTSEISVMFLSGVEDPAAAEYVRKKGSEGYLYKRMDADALLEGISDFFVRKDWDELRRKGALPEVQEIMPCSKCLLGYAKCPLRKEGSLCAYESLGLEPPEGRGVPA